MFWLINWILFSLWNIVTSSIADALVCFIWQHYYSQHAASSSSFEVNSYTSFIFTVVLYISIELQYTILCFKISTLSKYPCRVYVRIMYQLCNQPITYILNFNTCYHSFMFDIHTKDFRYQQDNEHTSNKTVIVFHIKGDVEIHIHFTDAFCHYVCTLFLQHLLFSS